jgi:hypothetical protein
MFQILEACRPIDACAKLRIGDFEISISSRLPADLRVYRNNTGKDDDLTGKVFGGDNYLNVDPTPENIVKAINWAVEADLYNQRAFSV